MPLDLMILKVGGSATTFKEENELKTKDEVIERVAEEIKAAKEKHDFNLVLVHGAGPFGHKLVHEYDVIDGIKDERGVEGFVKTHNSVGALNKKYVDIFAEKGLLLMPFQPSAIITNTDKKISHFNTEELEKIMTISPKIIPVLYGDMVFDEKLKGSIVSGDAIISFLAKKFKAEKVLFGSDVDGVFTADPKTNPEADLIPKIDNQNFEEILKKVEGAKAIDATGGMKNKLLELKEKLKGIKTVIFNLTQEENLQKLLAGEKGIGTEIFLQ